MNPQNQISSWTKYDRTPDIFRGVARLGAAPKILSFGCSTGEEVRTLRDKYFPDSVIHGIDIDPGIVDHNRRRNSDPGIEYFGHLSDTHFDYDVIFCMSVLCRWPDGQDQYYFETYHRTLLSIDRRLKPGGLLVIYNGQYFVEETFLRDHYEPLEIDNLDSGFVKKWHSDSSEFIGIYRTTVFRKSSSFERRYGVVWANTQNLGDDIQTLAAIWFLNRRGVERVELVNREALNAYEGAPLILVMNGWYMHDISKFPPPPRVMPLFISFHCSSEILVKANRAYLLRHGPIGCRDEATMEMLTRHGIPAYFTGCLTLTFDPVVEKTGRRLAVDINTCKYIPPVNVSAAELEGYLRVGHDLQEGFDRNNVMQRLEMARELLDLYGRAEEVVTSRLHCALPCRAMGTPVKFVHANLDDPRFSGLHGVLAGAARLDQARACVPRELIDRIVANFERVEI